MKKAYDPYADDPFHQSTRRARQSDRNTARFTLAVVALVVIVCSLLFVRESWEPLTKISDDWGKVELNPHRNPKQ